LDRLVPDFVRAIQRSEPIRIRHPSAVRPWQFVLEPLGGYLLLAQRLWEDAAVYSGPWNFGPLPAAHITVRELAERLVAAVGRGKIDVEEDDSLHETNYLALNCAKAHEKLHWQSALGVAETIAWTAEWYDALLRSPASIRDLTQQQIFRYERMQRSSSRGLRKVA
jgi:CDP-glucose 4,6-dehydratase